MKTYLHALLVALCVVVLGANAASAAEPEGPKARTSSIYSEVKKAAAEAKDRDSLVTKVLGYFDAFIDYEGFSERTLKTTWPTLTDAQKEIFKDRFKRLVIRTYAKRFTPGVEFAVEYRGEPKFTNDAKTESKVKTTIRSDKLGADVDYLLVLSDVKGVVAWRAIDIIVDDVSMALNWRKQFERIVAKDGFTGLIAKIDSRIAKD